MAPSPLRRLALAGMVALLLGGAPFTQIAEAAQRNSFEEDLALANAGDLNAQNRVASHYSFGVEGAPQDYAKAVSWRRKAAEQGDASAQYLLGGAYRRGRGVPQDYGEAVAWWRKAAEQRYWPAQISLGGAYDFGRGVPEDDVEAYKWYSLATTYCDEIGMREQNAEQRDQIAGFLTPEQRAEGQRRAREFFEAHPRE